MSVINDFKSGTTAFKVYKKLHAENQSREVYIFHTNNEEIKVIEHPYVGMIGKKGRKIVGEIR